MLKRCLIIILICFTGRTAYCIQPANQDSLLGFIGKLNSGSFGIIPNYATYHIYFDRNAKSIIKILSADSPKRVVLLRYMKDEGKAIAIHAILTKLYDSSKFYIESETIYAKEPHDVNTEIIGDRFRLNGLEWELRDSTPQNPSHSSFVTSNEMKKVKKYWKRRFSNPPSRASICGWKKRLKYSCAVGSGLLISGARVYTRA